MKKSVTKKRKEFNSSKKKLNSSKHPPVFDGFTILKDNPEGFFIMNTEDGSIFKWIDVSSLQVDNDPVTGDSKPKYCRRNFEGIFNDCLNPRNYVRRGYYETDDSKFKDTVKKYGGFYIAVYKARFNDFGKVGFSGVGLLADELIFYEAKLFAKNYAKRYGKKQFISCLPCGAAMDCVFQHIFQTFEDEVLDHMEEDETEYDAWNRIAKQYDFSNGIYGLHDFIANGPEFTTEAFENKKYHIVIRGGRRGLFLISDNDYEKERMEAFFELGHRTFISTESRPEGCGYRVVLLPGI